MFHVPQGLWEEAIREHRALRAELESQPTEKLQGMVDAYSRMQPLVSISSLLGFNDIKRLRLSKLILTKRKLGQLTEEELRRESSDVNPITDFIQSMTDFFGYNATYSRREIARDLLGKRTGLPYFG